MELVDLYSDNVSSPEPHEVPLHQSVSQPLDCRIWGDTVTGFMSVSDVVAFLEDQGIPERYSKEFKGNTNFIINCNTDVVLWGGH